MKVIVSANADKKCLPYAEKAKEFLEILGVEVINSANFGMEILKSVTDEKDAEFCVVLGGDGTILGACRTLLGLNIPVLGVNFGHLGYLAASEPDEMTDTLQRVINGDYYIEERVSLKAECCGKEFYGVNEAVLHRGAPHLIDVKVGINGQIADFVHADGIMAATPTGSTAYNLSAGGPIIVPTSESLVITPICAHSLGARPIVVGYGDKITFIPLGKSELSLDGISAGSVSENETVTVTAGKKIKLIRTGTDGFYRILRKKLGSID